MATRIIKNELQLAAWLDLLAAHKIPMTVSVVAGAKRSKQQNSTLHMWFGQIGKHTGFTASEVKGTCKLDHGLSIMVRDNPAWVEKWQPFYDPLQRAGDREHLVRLFEILPMTSLFSVKQMAELMDAVQVQYRGIGVYLTDPELQKYGDME